jgi:hypothetical protein
MTAGAQEQQIVKAILPYSSILFLKEGSDIAAKSRPHQAFHSI